MYYPKSQITTNLYTNGNEFIIASTSKVYIGPYYITSNGDAYSNKSPNDRPTEKLSRISVSNSIKPKLPNTTPSPASEFTPSDDDNRNSYYEIEKGGIYSVVPDQPTAPSPPRSIAPTPTDEEYELGEFTRYFGYKNSTQQTIETNKFDFDSLKDQSSLIQHDLFTPIFLTWMISGDKEKCSKTNFNLVRLKQSKEKLPGFSKYFEGKYDKYFKYGSNENLYSDGTELRFSKSKKPYIGFYHIHPEKGPMVGAQHVPTPHEFLEFITTGSILNPIEPTIQTGSVDDTPSLAPPVNYSGGSIGGGGGY
tara:strand:- start:1837 stop:2757 length:921 start_codon:yes stop_codon:yes gene_type:complete